MRKLLPALFISLLFFYPVKADDSFEIKDFNSEILMQDSGVIDVTETIDTDFYQQKHGIYRDIPTSGINLQLTGITDENGNPYPYQQMDFAEGKRFQIGDPNKTFAGERTYKISYEVRKVIRFYPDHDELYWNSTGNEWQVNIDKASATIKLPPKIKSESGLQFKCYTGETSSTAEDCTYKYDQASNSVTFVSSNPLSAYSGMTVAVWLPPNTFDHPGTLEVRSDPSDADVYLNGKFNCKTDCYDDSLPPGDYSITVKKFGYKIPEAASVKIEQGSSANEYFKLEKYLWFSILMFLLFAAAAVILLEPVYTYWRKGRDPKGTGVLVPEYDAPDNLNPAEVGTLVDEKADMRDLTSTIVDLAVRGYLIIKVLPDARGFIFKKDDYELIKTENPKPKGKRKELNPYETQFMDALFGSGNSVKVSDLEDEFYVHLNDLKDAVYTSLVSKGYFPKSPSSVRVAYFVKAFLLIFFGSFLVSFEANAFHSYFTSAVIANGVLTLIFANFMPQKKKKGTEGREYILGFRHYMEVAEKDRLKFQENENIFYEILPYAMALNVADKWSKAFKDVFKNPPEWYQGAGTGNFYPIAFTHNIQSMASSMNSAFASRPSSSGGSGFGGGGFSGGGFGGGGGGSW